VLVDALRPVLPGLDMALFEVDLTRIFNILGESEINWGGDIGTALDPSDNSIYVFRGKNRAAAEDRQSLLLKINEFGQIVAYRRVTDRRYQVPIIANSGKLYACESASWDESTTIKIDELSKSDLSLVQNIQSMAPATEMHYISHTCKASETVLCVVGGRGQVVPSEPGYGVYAKIDVVNKTKTVYTIPNMEGEHSGLIFNGVKYGNYMYFDLYGKFQGNHRINLSDFTYAMIGSPPSSTFDLAPMFYTAEGKMFHGHGGSGGQLGEQRHYWLTTGTSMWSEIPRYPFNNKYPGIFAAVYFPLLRKALIPMGDTRYYNYPANQFFYDVDTDQWTKVTHMFDLVCVPPQTVEMTDAQSVHGLRLGASGNGSGVTINGLQNECGGRAPQGFYKGGFYRFLLPMIYWYYDGAEKNIRKLVFGIVRVA